MILPFMGFVYTLCDHLTIVAPSDLLLVMLQLWKISAFFRENNVVITDQTEGQNYKKQTQVVINPTFSQYHVTINLNLSSELLRVTLYY